MEIIGWTAFALMLVDAMILHIASRRMRAERERRLPIRDLLRRM